MDPINVLGIASNVINFVDTSTKILEATAALAAIRDEQPDSTIVLSFRALQRVRIEALQQDLLQLNQEKEELVKPADTAGPEALEDFEKKVYEMNRVIDVKLHIYANALRDYEVLSQEAVPDTLPNAKLSSNIPFIHSRKSQHKNDPETQHREELRAKIPPNMRKYMFRELNREIRLEQKRKDAYSERLRMGAFGGIALIGPMLLMVLHRDLNTSIITASVATILFALALAVTARGLEGKDVLAATAAYAAVLVVFVGTSLPPIA